MLKIDQLRYMEDSLGLDYYNRLRNYILQIRFNSPVSRKLHNYTVLHDSLKREFDLQPDSLFNFDEFSTGRTNGLKLKLHRLHWPRHEIMYKP
jgi:lipopolysaccharide export system permease protein